MAATVFIGQMKPVKTKMVGNWMLKADDRLKFRFQGDEARDLPRKKFKKDLTVELKRFLFGIFLINYNF